MYYHLGSPVLYCTFSNLNSHFCPQFCRECLFENKSLYLQKGDRRGWKKKACHVQQRLGESDQWTAGGSCHGDHCHGGHGGHMVVMTLVMVVIKMTMKLAYWGWMGHCDDEMLRVEKSQIFIFWKWNLTTTCQIWEIELYIWPSWFATRLALIQCFVMCQQLREWGEVESGNNFFKKKFKTFSGHIVIFP